jgi:hypothetical protein
LRFNVSSLSLYRLKNGKA